MSGSTHNDSPRNRDEPRLPYSMEERIGLSLIIPTYEEKDNITPLLSQIVQAAATIPMDMEIIVVDDNSPDGTADLVVDWLVNTFGKIGIRNSEHVCLLPQGEQKEGCWVRVVRRPRKMGLASAVVEGMRRARGGILGFMDADLSHPPEAIPSMVLEILKPGGADLVIGSRYVTGPPRLELSWHRKLGSRLANWLARPILHVKDSTSGFVFFRRHVIEPQQLEAKGFKIGLEIIAKGRYCRLEEMPYQFSARASGKSKLNLITLWHFALQLARLVLTTTAAKLRPQLSRSAILKEAQR